MLDRRGGPAYNFGMRRLLVVLLVGAGSLVGCPIAAAAPPVVATGPAVGVSYYNLCFPHATSSLTLTGEVDPQGLPTSWYFEYGSGGSLDLQTPVQIAPRPRRSPRRSWQRRRWPHTGWWP